MSALNKGKHIVEEIDGTRCTIVEKCIDENRMKFLKDLLEFNKYEVKVATDKDNLSTIGVTDIIFNPIIAVYEKTLHTPDGKVVTPAFWNQYSANPPRLYWKFQPCKM